MNKKCFNIFMRTLLLAMVLLAGAPAQASDAIRVVGALIEQGKFDEADKRVAKYLKRDPKDVDALMMQGNVMLQRYFGKGMMSITANDNASIYDRSIGRMGQPPHIVPRALAVQIAALWARCLELDPTRGDIWRGTAYLYAMALMKQELIAHFPRMKAALPQEKGLPYNMGDYARMFNERERFDDAMDVYRAMLRLYPKRAWIYNDMAVLTYQRRHFPKALGLMQKAVKARAPTWQMYSTATTFFTLSEDYPFALKMHRKLSVLKSDQRWRLYRGLVRLARGKGDWRADLKAYYAKADDVDEDKPLAKFLLSADNALDYASYKKAARISSLMQFGLLVHRWGIRIAPSRHDPLYAYARMMNENHNFAVSAPLYKKLLTMKTLPVDWREQVRVEYAWALHVGGQKKVAARQWRQLVKAEDAFIKNAALYFLGDDAWNRGDKQAALRYFRQLDKDKPTTKYAAMARGRVDAMKGR